MSRNIQHTPGPWKKLGDFITAEPQHSPNGEACTIARAYDAGGDTPDSRSAVANARLIAAAPEMLEALEVLVANAEIVGDPRMEGLADCYAIPPDDINAARAAIAKAKGTA